MYKLLPILALCLLNVGCASMGPGLTYWELVNLSGGPIQEEALLKYCSEENKKWDIDYRNSNRCKTILTEEEKLEIDYYLIFGDE